MSLEYINSLIRRSTSMRTDISSQTHEQTEDDEEDKLSEQGRNLKPGFLNSIKRRIQRRFTGVRSKVKSRLQKSASLNENHQGALPPPAINEINEDISTSAERSNVSVAAESETSELRTQSLSGHLLQLSKYGWYWGPITREEAEEKLANQPEGSFLVILLFICLHSRLPYHSPLHLPYNLVLAGSRLFK